MSEYIFVLKKPRLLKVRDIGQHQVLLFTYKFIKQFLQESFVVYFSATSRLVLTLISESFSMINPSRRRPSLNPLLSHIAHFLPHAKLAFSQSRSKYNCYYKVPTFKRMSRRTITDETLTSWTP